MAFEECLAPHAEMRAPKGLRGGAGLAEICYLPRKCLSIDSEVIDGTTLIVRIESRAEAAAYAWIYSDGSLVLDTASRRHQKCSCLSSQRGRLHSVDRLRRPRWRNHRP